MHSVNFGRWLQRLGMKTGQEPDFISAVQPVSVVHDSQALVPPELGDIFAQGGERSGIAAVFPRYSLTAGARGLLASVTVSGANLNAYRWTIGTTPAVLANAVALTAAIAMNENGRPTPTAVSALGTTVASFNVSVPAWRTNASVVNTVDVYIRPGTTFEVGGIVANTTITIYAIWQEVEYFRAQ